MFPLCLIFSKIKLYFNYISISVIRIIVFYSFYFISFICSSYSSFPWSLHPTFHVFVFQINGLSPCLYSCGWMQLFISEFWVLEFRKSIVSLSSFLNFCIRLPLNVVRASCESWWYKRVLSEQITQSLVLVSFLS